MKRFLHILVISLISFIGYGQIVPVSDSGYYYGVVNDSLMNKYIFMSFLSNDGDNILHVVPYVIGDGTDSSFMHNNYKELLDNRGDDSIDGNIFIDYGWNIPGFDNYCYYSLDQENISFSLNVASLDKQYLDVFQFNGKLLNNGTTIESIVSSTDSIFEKSVLILNYQEK